jgi:starch phosphorylase
MNSGEAFATPSGVHAGSSDLAAAAAALRSRLPEPLGALAGLAYNYRWSWTPGGPELFGSVDTRRWTACAGNPVRLLQEVHPDRLARLAGDHAFLERLAALEEAIAGALAGEPAEWPG